ncbi:hypothetical protein WA158_007374 [Blastocystis sp. Blastoise]
MTIIDRTNDFKRIIVSLAGSKGHENYVATKSSIKPSDFSRVTSTLSGNVHATSLKLQQLTQLVKKKCLFDDKTEEINTLTVAIKDEITHINSELEKLEMYVKGNKSGSTQTALYNQNIVGALKDELIDTTKEFKDVLQLHHQTLENTQQRKQKLGASQPDLLGKPLNYSVPTSDTVNISIPSTTTALLTPSSFALQDSQIISNRYIQERSQAVTDIESNMIQLGSIFDRLSTMIVEQGEMVDRIDDNIDKASINVNSGYQEIVKYGQTIFSNRQLILKLFAVLVVFIILFVIFLA